MKVVNISRSDVYKIVRLTFDYLQIRPIIVELGVLRGENALDMLAVFEPRSMFLIDSWSAQLHEEYVSWASGRPWMASANAFEGYYGGPLSEQATYDRNHESTMEKFAQHPEVAIIRLSTFAAREIVRQNLGNGYGLDLLYVDASHQYQDVLRDLMLYSELVAPDGIIQLNDCCHSDEGVRQNLGVLEAVTKFCKMTEFVPLLITNTDWSDVVLARKGSQMARIADIAVDTVGVSYVEVPPSMLGAARVRSGARPNLSFC